MSLSLCKQWNTYNIFIVKFPTLVPHVCVIYAVGNAHVLCMHTLAFSSWPPLPPGFTNTCAQCNHAQLCYLIHTCGFQRCRHAFCSVDVEVDIQIIEYWTASFMTWLLRIYYVLLYLFDFTSLRKLTFTYTETLICWQIRGCHNNVQTWSYNKADRFACYH